MKRANKVAAIQRQLQAAHDIIEQAKEIPLGMKRSDLAKLIRMIEAADRKRDGMIHL